MSDRLPHVDGSGRGLDDGDCIHCGDSGNLESTECHVRLREALDAAKRQRTRGLTVKQEGHIRAWMRVHEDEAGVPVVEANLWDTLEELLGEEA